MKKLRNEGMRFFGFGLLGLITVIAVILLLAGGSLYLSKLKEQTSIQKIGLDAERQAREVTKKIEDQQKNLQKLTQ